MDSNDRPIGARSSFLQIELVVLNPPVDFTEGSRCSPRRDFTSGKQEPLELRAPRGEWIELLRERREGAAR